MYNLVKMSLSGSIVYQLELPDLDAIAKHLKTSRKNVDAIVSGIRFPPGKTRVLNKYIIQKKSPVEENPFQVSFP